MSYRVCANCNFVINNSIHQEDECPKCNSKKMKCPIDNDDNWDKLYEKQTADEHLKTDHKEGISKSHILLSLYMRGNVYITMSDIKKAEKIDYVFDVTKKIPLKQYIRKICIKYYNLKY